MQVILASNSPRRKELFARITPSFTAIPAGVDERVPLGTSPCDTVKILAQRKAEYVLKNALNAGMGGINSPLIVLGSDTVVAYGNTVLGKPKDEKDAFDMLKLLSGRTHRVYTGVCFATERGVWLDADISEVTFRRLTDEEIRAYIATGSPMDKAGSYGIQDGNLVEKLEGSYTNVVGLPLELTARMYEEVIKNVENSD